MKQIKRSSFIVLTNPRSGSSWMVVMLRSHPDIEVYGELFHIPAVPVPKNNKKKTKLNRILRWSDWNKQYKGNVFKYLDEVFAKSEAVGFKLMFGHVLKQPLIAIYIATRRIPLIFLRRENFLDVLVSKETLKLRNIAHTHADVEQIKVVLEPAEVVKQLKRLIYLDKATSLLCSVLPTRVLRVSYEELTKNANKWNELQSFIRPDEPPYNLHSSYKKLNKLPKSELIENYEELARHLKNCGLERFLDN